MSTTGPAYRRALVRRLHWVSAAGPLSDQTTSAAATAALARRLHRRAELALVFEISTHAPRRPHGKRTEPRHDFGRRGDGESTAGRGFPLTTITGAS